MNSQQLFVLSCFFFGQSAWAHPESEAAVEHGGRGGGSGGRGGGFGGHGGHGKGFGGHGGFGDGFGRHGGFGGRGFGHYHGGHGGFFPGAFRGPMGPPPMMMPPYPMPLPAPMPIPFGQPPMIQQPMPMQPQMPMGSLEGGFQQDGNFGNEGGDIGFGNQMVRRVVYQESSPQMEDLGVNRSFARASARVSVGSTAPPMMSSRILVAEAPLRPVGQFTGQAITVSRRLNQGTEGLGIDIDGQASQPMPPQEAPAQMPPSQPMPPQMPPQMPLQPPMEEPSAPTLPPAGNRFSVKGFSKKTESFSEQKSGSKTTTEEYERMGTWDTGEYTDRGGKMVQGQIVFEAPKSAISQYVPAEQQGISSAAVGYQGRAAFYNHGSSAGTCGYVPNITNYVSLPSKYMPNACNRCVAIRSGNTFVKALVVNGYQGDNMKSLQLSTDLCSGLGVTPDAQIKVDWDFVAC